MKKVFKYAGIGILSIFVLSIISVLIGLATGQVEYAKNPSANEQKEPEMIALNVCETDKENADYWRRTNVNLFEFPNGKGRSFQIPSCDSIQLEVMDRKSENGIENYLVRYQDGQGWQTKRLLTGRE